MLDNKIESKIPQESMLPAVFYTRVYIDEKFRKNLQTIFN